MLTCFPNMLKENPMRFSFSSFFIEYHYELKDFKCVDFKPYSYSNCLIFSQIESLQIDFWVLLTWPSSLFAFWNSKMFWDHLVLFFFFAPDLELAISPKSLDSWEMIFRSFTIFALGKLIATPLVIISRSFQWIEIKRKLRGLAFTLINSNLI